MAAVVFLCSDMMFSSRVLGAAATLGVNCKLVPNPALLAGAVADACRLVLVDLTLPGLDVAAAVTVVRGAAPPAKIVAFGPHVDEGLLASASAAGCDVVWTRSQFSKQYAELLREAAE
jgi:DNA-binding NarL/FixJ family response regulator